MFYLQFENTSYLVLTLEYSWNISYWLFKNDRIFWTDNCPSVPWFFNKIGLSLSGTWTHVCTWRCGMGVIPCNWGVLYTRKIHTFMFAYWVYKQDFLLACKAFLQCSYSYLFIIPFPFNDACLYCFNLGREFTNGLLFSFQVSYAHLFHSCPLPAFLSMSTYWLILGEYTINQPILSKESIKCA